MNSFAFASEKQTGLSEGSMPSLAFRGKAASGMSQSAEEALRSVRALVEELLIQVVSSRNAEEYRASYEEVLPKYVAFLTAYGNIIRGSLTPRSLKQLNYESLLELEAVFRTSGMESFGELIKDQAIFATWTLRHMNELVRSLAAESVAESHREGDQELAHMCCVAIFQTRFSLDCLIIAMNRGVAVFPDVLAGLSDGLRTAVNAYAYARQGHLLRQDVATKPLPPIEWDDEDDMLLAASELEARI